MQRCRSPAHHGYALRFATVAVIGPGWLRSSNEILPMLGTLAHALVRAEPALVPVTPLCLPHTAQRSLLCSTPNG
jgi:hypothetical protein